MFSLLECYYHWFNSWIQMVYLVSFDRLSFKELVYFIHVNKYVGIELFMIFYYPFNAYGLCSNTFPPLFYFWYYICLSSLFFLVGLVRGLLTLLTFLKNKKKLVVLFSLFPVSDILEFSSNFYYLFYSISFGFNLLFSF